MPPTLKKLKGHIAFGLSVCVCALEEKKVRFFKFHKQIPHQKIADHIFFSMNYFPMWSYAPFNRSE